MKLIFTFMLLLSFEVHAQQNQDSLWYSFWDAETDLQGFKDDQGKVKIPAKFVGGFTTAQKFNKIVAVAERLHDNSFATYYLLKNGRKKGIDSVFFWDNAADCESEGKIRFHEKETDRVGFLGASGGVIIPATYNFALPFRNGLTVAVVGAEKVCFDGMPFSRDSPCEHWRLEGSTNLLINAKNEILVRDFDYKPALDLYSVKISKEQSDDPNRVSFKGTNGKFYSFVDLEKEFRNWFDCEFVSSPDAFSQNSFEEINYFSKEKSKYLFTDKKEFLSKNGDLLAVYFNAFKNDPPKYFISSEGLNPFIFEAKKYEAFFDNCRNAKEWQYPLMTLVISIYDANCDYQFQDHIQFLKTKKGYKLLSLYLSSAKLRE